MIRVHAIVLAKVYLILVKIEANFERIFEYINFAENDNYWLLLPRLETEVRNKVCYPFRFEANSEVLSQVDFTPEIGWLKIKLFTEILSKKIICGPPLNFQKLN